MLCRIDCRCRWFELVKVAQRVEAEVLAEHHAAQDWRRPYRHETTVAVVEE